jgi:hypothetical protein
MPIVRIKHHPDLGGKLRNTSIAARLIKVCSELSYSIANETQRFCWRSRPRLLQRWVIALFYDGQKFAIVGVQLDGNFYNYLSRGIDWAKLGCCRKILLTIKLIKPINDISLTTPLHVSNS